MEGISNMINLYVCSFIEIHKTPDTSLSSLQDEFLQPTTNPLPIEVGYIYSFISSNKKWKILGSSYNSWGIMPQQNSLILTSKTAGINAIYYITTSKNRNYSYLNSTEVNNILGSIISCSFPSWKEIFIDKFWQLQSLETHIVVWTDSLASGSLDSLILFLWPSQTIENRVFLCDCWFLSCSTDSKKTSCAP